MIFLIAFLCFAITIAAMFTDGQAHLHLRSLKHTYDLTYSYSQIAGVSSVLIVGGMLCLRFIKKIILTPLGLYVNYKARKQDKATKQALEGYLKYIAGYKEGGLQFKDCAKQLKDNLFYWLLGSQIPEMADQSYNELARYSGGGFIKLFYEVNSMLDKQHYENALLRLETADEFIKTTKWFHLSSFKCFLGLKEFDKARLALKKMKQSDMQINQYEIELAKIQVKDGIDVMANLEYIYSQDKSVNSVVKYAKELIKSHRNDEAEKVIQSHWDKHPCVEVGALLNDLCGDLTAREKFAITNEFVKKHQSHFAAKYMVAKSALEAGFFLLARESLLELAETHASLAFPLLAKLEKLEHNDERAANNWLERALKTPE